MIEASNLSKNYDSFIALDDVSFSIQKGDVVGLLGPNGAGKTTLIRILTGFFEASNGQVTINGIDVEESPQRIQQEIGYLPENTPLYEEMLVQEYLTMIADIRNLPIGSKRSAMLGEAIEATGLENYLTKPIHELSKGLKQRVGLAQAIVHQPKVLILDEPTSGLDPTQVVQVRELIHRLAQTSTVLFSTHILSEVEQVCERALIVLGGKLRVDAKLIDLRASQSAILGIAETVPGSGVPQLVEAGASIEQPQDIRQVLKQLSGVQAVRQIYSRPGYLTYEINGANKADLCREAFGLARKYAWELGELRPVERDLETVFQEVVQENDAGLH